MTLAGRRVARVGQRRAPRSHTDDQLALMGHLDIDKFMMMGFCIGSPTTWSLLNRAPERVVAAVMVQPSGSRPEMRDLFYQNNMARWAPELVNRRSESKTIVEWTDID